MRLIAGLLPVVVLAHDACADSTPYCAALKQIAALASSKDRFASIAGALHKPKISWFNGAGGPVPITPGYVPYIVTTRQS